MVLNHIQSLVIQVLVILVIIRILVFAFRKYFVDRPFQWIRQAGTQWAVVTGSTDGIGAEFARSLALKGYNLALISRTESKLAQTKSKIEQELFYNNLTPVKVKTLAVDFTETNIYDKIETFLEDKDVHVLVNNVGMAYGSPKSFVKIYDHDHAFYQKLVNVNICSTLHLCEAIVPKMVAKQDGLVLNVSSLLGVYPSAGTTTYGSTKVKNASNVCSH